MTHYHAYLTSSEGALRADVGDVPVGTNTIDVQADTSGAGVDLVAVFTVSALTESSTPTTVAAVDQVTALQSLAFADSDPSIGEIGGTATWDEPGAGEPVTGYHRRNRNPRPQPQKLSKLVFLTYFS